MGKKLNAACTTTTASVNVITFNWRQRTSFITPNACEPTNAAICDNQAQYMQVDMCICVWLCIYVYTYIYVTCVYASN